MSTWDQTREGESWWREAPPSQESQDVLLQGQSWEGWVSLLGGAGAALNSVGT